MSRAYKIKVAQSARRILRASDHVCTQLELLGILPQDRMAELLVSELQTRGFRKVGDKDWRRTQAGVVTEVDPHTGTVTVRAEVEQSVLVEGERQTWSEAKGTQAKRVEDSLRTELQKDLQRQADQEKAKLQRQVTDRLEAHLGDLRKELDHAVNRVTAAALKEKAAQLGQIKEVTEDAATGSLTIVLEV